MIENWGGPINMVREFPGKGDKFLETTNESRRPHHFHTPFLTIEFVIITSHKLSPSTLHPIPRPTILQVTLITRGPK